MLEKPSGRFVLRIDPSLHRRLRDIAEQKDASLNLVCASILEEAVEGRGSLHKCMGIAGQALRWVQRFESRAGVSSVGVILFGSAARGELRASSDIDLLVALPASSPLRRSLYRDWDETMSQEAQTRLYETHEVNPHFVHVPEKAEEAGSLWLEAAIEGQLLADHEGIVHAFLVKLRRMLAEGQVSSYRAHGHRYWSRRR